MDMPELETMTLTMRVSSCSLSFVRKSAPNPAMSLSSSPQPRAREGKAIEEAYATANTSRVKGRKEGGTHVVGCCTMMASWTLSSLRNLVSYPVTIVPLDVTRPDPGLACAVGGCCNGRPM